MHEAFDQIVDLLDIHDAATREKVYTILRETVDDAKEAETERQHRAICDCIRSHVLPLLRDAKVWASKGVGTGTLDSIENAEFCLKFLSPQR